MDARNIGKRRAIAADSADFPFDQEAFQVAKRWAVIGQAGPRAEILDRKAKDDAPCFRNNIESYIGTINIPVGLAGPLRVLGANGPTNYRVPLATTEAALVASYNRGARLLTEAGGCKSRVVAEGISRTPMFAFNDVLEAEEFSSFIDAIHDCLGDAVTRVTAHGRLVGVQCLIEGNHVYVDLQFTTGDASGQNMVTFASDAICQRILTRSPVKPRYWFLEGNLSGDKKSTTRSMGDVRGKRVVADITIPRTLVEQLLHTTPERMVEYWYAGAIGGVMSGATGIQGHFANGLAALYLACGQDVACVAESATGVTRLESTAKGDLYASVTLPNVMVGTVGGGTALPSAKACLDILGLAGTGNSGALAEVCAAIVLAGELSIIGAFCSGDFALAHRALSQGEAMERSRNHD